MATLSEAEINVWAAYRERHGFPCDRLGIGVANAGAYVGATWGGKAKPADLLPQFAGARKRKDDIAGVRAWFRARAKPKDVTNGGE